MAKEMATKKLKAVYEIDKESGWWLVSVPEIQGCRTQARSLNQARERIREALESCFEDLSEADNIELVAQYNLPNSLVSKIKETTKLREKIAEEENKAQAQMRQCARSLVSVVGLSYADTGVLLGVSKPRAEQLVKGR
jgi:predicted RNase H-like HicB family nuclease